MLGSGTDFDKEVKLNRKKKNVERSYLSQKMNEMVFNQRNIYIVTLMEENDESLKCRCVRRIGKRYRVIGAH